MSNTVITNYTDLNGPSTKADSSVVVIVNKDGSLSVDQNLLGTLMGTDGSQAAGISVVRVGHEGRPDDATDSESEDDKVPHVTLSVDSYYDEPNSIIKYDSGAEMLQSLRIETRENSLVGFHNDHCYTPFTSPSQTVPQTNENNYSTYDEPVIEITHTPPPKPVPSSKKITILEQQIIPKGKKLVLNSSESPVIHKGNELLNKTLPVLPKSKNVKDQDKSENSQKSDDTSESSSITSGESIPDRDSDSDYKDTKDRSISLKIKKTKLKPRILKSSKAVKLDSKVASRLKANKNVLKKEVKEKINKNISDKKETTVDIESLIPTSEIPTSIQSTPVVVSDQNKSVKSTPKSVKREKKTPAHVTALLSDMTSLFSTPDVIRRVSTDNKLPTKSETTEKRVSAGPKSQEISNELKTTDLKTILDSSTEKTKICSITSPKTYLRQKDKITSDKVSKSYELTATIPQLDEASLAQILQDTSGITTNPVKNQPTMSTVNTINSPGLTGPLSPTLDLLGGLQPEEEGLTEDLLMHVAQLVESSENLQEVIDKQVLGKVDSTPTKLQVPPPYQQTPSNSLYAQTLNKSAQKLTTRHIEKPIEIVRRDGRVITLPPIEAPATRSSKRKSQVDTSTAAEVVPTPVPDQPLVVTPEPQVPVVSKQYTNKKLTNKKQEPLVQTPVIEKVSAESQESWNSEDDPYRLWCICKQPHNNRFMICCDGCEDWFHGKCVNITKAMGQQMEEQGIEWRCPNCIKKTKSTPKTPLKATTPVQKKIDSDTVSTPQLVTKEAASKTSCIVCKKPARASSIYCSDACILKHAQDSLGNQTPTKPDAESGKSSDKQKCDSRVIVYERKSGRLLAGPNAPTAENLKAWLQKNPTFEVVRPGTLNTIKPNVITKKKLFNEPNKIQTTLSFERIPRKSLEQPSSSKTVQSEQKLKAQSPDVKLTKTPTIIKTKMLPEAKMKPLQLETKARIQPEKMIKLIQSPREEIKLMPQPKTPVATRSHPPQYPDSPKPSTSTPKNEARKLNRSASRTSSAYEKAPSVSPSTSRRKDSQDANKNKMDSTETIRENVRKALQEQLSIRMAENTGPKFSEEEIQRFCNDTEYELHELFRDVGMKYKAKYRSLMFNIKDRKNLSLWQKICDRTITPKQLVRLSPEELASQELAQWRDQEVKHQLELIKKSELDMLAASKTYVLKTHKGEEVMETKESVSTELDPNVPVEDLVTALNDSTTGEENKTDNLEDLNSTTGKSDSSERKYGSSRKRGRDDNSSEHSKKEKRDSKRGTESRKSRSSRRKSDIKDKETKEERRSTRRRKSVSRDRSRETKEKSHEHSHFRSRSRLKSKRRSKSREHSRSTSHSRDRSRSRGRSRGQSRRSTSPVTSKSKKRSRSKVISSTEDKHKHRSRSQDNVYSKNKHDSTDSDSIERPKSAMMKEAHPEYDPHEPMITSAFSDEDLKKSREDVYDDTYKTEIGDYDPSKSFAIDSNIIIPSPKYVAKQDKLSEPESDQEPSSTVDNSAAIVWNGCINMVDVARFYVAAHEVSGSASDLEEDLSAELEIVGRINPDTVWDYINKMKRGNNKDIVVLKLQAANDEEKMQYIALYSYLSSRNRLGVVKVSNTTSLKDIYIVPLPANTALPAVLLPLDGPGLGEVKTHLLISIIVRQRKKRIAPHIPKNVIPEKIARTRRKHSYTPPPVGGAGGAGGSGSYTPPALGAGAGAGATVAPSPRSPRRRALPLPAYTSPALSTSVKDKIAASLAAADDEEAYSPGSSSSGGSVPSGSLQPASNTLRTKMEELNRQIEEQKQQILKMAQADSSVAPEDEAYSPSRPMTPPPVPLADIALPSNLQEILATIKQRSEPTSDVDMRTMPLPP